MDETMAPDYQNPAFLDVIEELIFIIDLHNYDLLFMNRVARKRFQVTGSSYLGHKCYEILRHVDAPCLDCGGAGLCHGTRRWSTCNPLFREYHQLSDTYLHFRGHEARLQMAVDVTKQMQQSQELIMTLSMENAMTEAVRMLYISLDLPRAMHDMLQYIGDHLQADRAYVFEIVGQKLIRRFCWSRLPSETTQQDQLPAALLQRWQGEFERRQVICVADVAAIKQEFPDEYRIMRQHEVHSYVEAPLMINGQVAGFMGLDNLPPDRIKNLGSAFMTLAYFVAASIVAAQKRSLLEKLSYSDTMTGVANRNAFIRDLERYQSIEEQQQPVGVVYVDLNGLKRVNDTQGHRAGDQMIVAMAETIARFFPPETIYRTGGDEFVVICLGLARIQFMEQVSRMVSRISRCATLDASVGYAWREHSRDVQAAVAAADAVMYVQKRQYYMK